MYCISSKKALRQSDIHAVNLEEIITAQGNPRYIAQSAWMVGPVQQPLPIDCIAMRVYAPACIFREYAKISKLENDHDLFPGPDVDPVLQELLSLPWVHIPLKDTTPQINIQAYRRGLTLPEYGWKPVKRHDPRVAFYRNFWVANEYGIDVSPFDKATYFLSPEVVYHGISENDELIFPHVTEILQDKKYVILEIDGLVHNHISPRTAEFVKGIVLELLDDDVVCVSELLVEHPGMRPQGCGIAQGRHFDITDASKWTALQHENDCPCGNDFHHLHHLTVVSHFEDLLKTNRYENVSDGIFVYKGLKPTLNLDHLKQEEEKSLRYFDIEQ